MPLAHPLRPLGLQDLLDSPDDGYRYEVIDGALVVNPAPAWRHQEIVASLAVILRQSAPEDVVVLPSFRRPVPTSRSVALAGRVERAAAFLPRGPDR